MNKMTLVFIIKWISVQWSCWFAKWCNNLNQNSINIPINLANSNSMQQQNRIKFPWNKACSKMLVRAAEQSFLCIYWANNTWKMDPTHGFESLIFCRLHFTTQIQLRLLSCIGNHKNENWLRGYHFVGTIYIDIVNSLLHLCVIKIEALIDMFT